MILKVRATPGETLFPGDPLAVDGDGLVRKALPGEHWMGTVPETEGRGLPELPVGEIYFTPRVSWVLVAPEGED